MLQQLKPHQHWPAEAEPSAVPTQLAQHTVAPVPTPHTWGCSMHTGSDTEGADLCCNTTSVKTPSNTDCPHPSPCHCFPKQQGQSTLTWAPQLTPPHHTCTALHSHSMLCTVTLQLPQSDAAACTAVAALQLLACCAGSSEPLLLLLGRAAVALHLGRVIKASLVQELVCLCQHWAECINEGLHVLHCIWVVRASHFLHEALPAGHKVERHIEC